MKNLIIFDFNGTLLKRNTSLLKEGSLELLKKFAETLDGINDSDFVFRIYGDDFIVLNKDHYEIKDDIPKLEEVLKGSGVTISLKHFDIDKDKIENITDLENLL